MLVIEPVRNNIIVQFLEEITNSRFINTAASGLIISSTDGNQAQLPRWAKVTHVGPEVRTVKIDDFVLIDAGKWTVGFDVEGARFWKTDEDQIVGVADTPGTTY